MDFQIEMEGKHYYIRGGGDARPKAARNRPPPPPRGVFGTFPYEKIQYCRNYMNTLLFRVLQECVFEEYFFSHKLHSTARAFS